MKTNTNLFWHLLLILATIVAGVSIACQTTAAALRYSSRLGEAWFYFADTPIYEPWRFFGWWYSYHAYAPEIFERGGLIAASSGFAAIIVAVILSLIRARAAKHVSTYGSSRWATSKDIRKAGLFDESGVFLGEAHGEYLRHDGPEHVMAFAPTRSGKGVGLVVPTLLSWTGSAIIHDIKGENWKLTAGWRSKFSRTLRFDPTSPTSIRYNPIQEIRKGHREISDVQNIADILVDPEASTLKANHWEKTANALMAGSILHILYAEEEKSLTGLVKFLSHPTRTIDETIKLMLQTNHIGTEEHPQVHPQIAQYAREVKDKTPAERSGVVSTALTCLQLYRDPVVAAATSVCDFNIDDLINGDDPVSLYLAVPPSDISRTKPLIRLLLNQIGRRLTEGTDDAPRDHDVLFMLDEFPMLGRLDFFESALGYMASYGLRAYLITQSLNQIDKAYGQYNAILDHCHVRVAFATNDERTAKRISDALGTATEQRVMKNYAGHRLAPWLSHVMVSRQETARQLLTPGEVMQLPEDDELVLLSGKRPIRAKKLRYYEDQNFTPRRIDSPSPDTYRLPAPTSDWAGLRAHLHTDLLLSEEDAKFGTATKGGQERAPELNAQREPQQSELELADGGMPDSGSDAMDAESDVRDAYNLDEANDVGMLGRSKK
ncbi:MAG: IncP-type conjugal transfer protein TraG [Pseudomonadota bacterium]